MLLANMVEQDTSSPSPEDLLKLKDKISEQWQQLPIAHQETMMLVLLGQMLEGERGAWILAAIELLWKTHSPPAEQLLPIPHLSYADLQQTNLTPEEIAQLDDDDLKHITHEMLRHYANDVFWEELEFVARFWLEGKRKTNT